MNRLRKLIIEALQTPKKKDCNCGCGGCSSKRIGPILNENMVFNTPLSNNLKHYIDNNIPLNKRLDGMKSNEYSKIITEARSLYSRLVLNVNDKKDKKILESKLLKEDRFIVMYRRKDSEALKKKGFDPEYPAFAPEAVKKGGWNKGKEFMVSYGDYETPRDRAKAHAEKNTKEDGETFEYGVHLQRDRTRFEEKINLGNAKEMFMPVRGGQKTFHKEMSKMFEDSKEDYSKYYDEFKEVFRDILDKLNDIDTSIDFVAAGITGADPIDIDINQKTMGRFANVKGVKENMLNEGWPTGLLSLLGLALMAWSSKNNVSVETPSDEEFEFQDKDWNKADEKTRSELLSKLYKTAGSNVKNTDVKVKMTWDELIPVVGKELGDKIYTFNK
tara:strand:- start:182 stop:1342 length:1161 start_codon:yes stop_codon:yes gene_type:complete